MYHLLQHTRHSDRQMISLKFNLTSFSCVSSTDEAPEPAGPPEKQSQLETEPKVRCLTRNALSRNKEI